MRALLSASGVVFYPAITLRGYGTLPAIFRPMYGGAAALTHLICQSAEKAHLMQAKYLSDLTCLPGTRKETLTAGGQSQFLGDYYDVGGQSGSQGAIS